MSRPLTQTELAALERAAAIGFHREDPPVPEVLVREGDPAPGLTLLAFAAGQRRLDGRLPRAPAEVARVVPPEDPRPVVPPAIRAGLRRLAGAARRAKAEVLVTAAGRAIADRGMRIHPFDTDLLAPLRVAAGPYEAWLAAEAGLPSWADPAAELRAARHADPEAARARIEAAWPGAKADLRLRMLASMEVRLGPADVPFLQGLAKDRSVSVRELATNLAKRAGPAVADAELARDLPVARVAFVGPKRVRVREGADAGRLFAALAARPLGSTLATLGTDLETLLASPEVAGLLPALALAALHEGRSDAHEALLRGAVQRGFAGEGPWRERMRDVPREIRREMLRPLLAGPLVPVLARSLGDATPWVELLEGPLPPAASRALRSTPEWRALLRQPEDPSEQAKAVQALVAAAPLVPGEDAPDAVSQLDALAPHAAPLVRLYWTLVADLASPPPQPSPTRGEGEDPRGAAP